MGGDGITNFLFADKTRDPLSTFESGKGEEVVGAEEKGETPPSTTNPHTKSMLGAADQNWIPEWVTN